MKSHQAHPGLNAFQMAYSKWFILPIFSIYIWKFITNNEIIENQNKLIIDEETKFHFQKFQFSFYYNRNLYCAIFFLYFILSQLYVQITILFLTPDHAIMESVVVQIVIGIIGIFTFSALIISKLNFIKLKKLKNND
jgi:hypothetical protein